MKAKKLIVFALVASLLLSTLACGDKETSTPTFPEQSPTFSEKSFSVPPLMTANMHVYAVAGDIMEGYLTATDSGGEIWFKIRDPHDDTVYSERFSTTRHDFIITCEHSGFYTLLVSNPSSTEKNVCIQVRLR